MSRAATTVKKWRRPCLQATMIALVGWAAPLPRGVARLSDLPKPDQGEVGALWRGGLPAIVKLWRRHSVWLRAEATQLGITPGCSLRSRPAFYAEQVAGASPAKGKK